MMDECNRRTVLNMIGLSTVGISSIGASKATQNGGRNPQRGRKKANEETRTALENSGWSQKNKNIYWKVIDNSNGEIPKSNFEEISGVKILNYGKSNCRLQANLNQLPFRDKEAMSRYNELKNAKKKFLNNAHEDPNRYEEDSGE